MLLDCMCSMVVCLGLHVLYGVCLGLHVLYGSIFIIARVVWLYVLDCMCSMVVCLGLHVLYVCFRLHMLYGCMLGFVYVRIRVFCGCILWITCVVWLRV